LNEFKELLIIYYLVGQVFQGLS